MCEDIVRQSCLNSLHKLLFNWLSDGSTVTTIQTIFIFTRKYSFICPLHALFIQMKSHNIQLIFVFNINSHSYELCSQCDFVRWLTTASYLKKNIYKNFAIWKRNICVDILDEWKLKILLTLKMCRVLLDDKMDELWNSLVSLYGEKWPRMRATLSPLRVGFGLCRKTKKWFRYRFFLAWDWTRPRAI